LSAESHAAARWLPLKKKLSAQKYLLILTVPAVIWLAVFCYAPMYGVLIAFKDYNVGLGVWKSPNAGLKYFVELANDPYFRNAVRNTLMYSVLGIVIGFPVPIIFAVLLNELRKWIGYKKVIQTVSYLPHFLSWAFVSSYLITFLSDSGVMNSLLVKLGILNTSYSFLGNELSFVGVILVSSIWKSFGYSSIIYLAVIVSIPMELFEAAYVDGASRFKRVWHITLPSIKPTITVLLILSISTLINSNFEQFYLLQNPLVSDISRVIDVYTYQIGFRMARFSYATAVGLFKSVVSIVLLTGANFMANRLTGSGIY